MWNTCGLHVVFTCVFSVHMWFTCVSHVGFYTCIFRKGKYDRIHMWITCDCSNSDVKHMCIFHKGSTLDCFKMVKKKKEWTSNKCPCYMIRFSLTNFMCSVIIKPLFFEKVWWKSTNPNNRLFTCKLSEMACMNTRGSHFVHYNGLIVRHCWSFVRYQSSTPR
jgi:hypothetical protein